MPWDKNGDAIVFECDDCEKVEPCNIQSVWATSTAPIPNGLRHSAAAPTDFAVCWQYMQGIGWRTFKRIGHPWTMHCVTCGPAAEVAHNEHQRMEAQRDRLKHKNARE